MIVTQILDQSPTPYIVILGFMLKWIGSYMNQRYPRIGFFQYAFAVGVFAVIGLRRLVIDPPTDGLEVLVAVMRAGGFAMIAFGITGAVATMILLYQDWNAAIRQDRAAKKSQIEAIQRSRREAEERRQRKANQPSAEEREQQRIDSLKRQREREAAAAEEIRKREADLAHRKTMRMKILLEAQAVLEDKRQEPIRQYVDSWLEDDLPMEEFEKRLAMIRDHIAGETEKEKPVEGYQSMRELDAEFTRQLKEVDSLDQTEIEKESLRAFLYLEKQNAMHDFLQKEGKR